jgi:predicted secreted acid phosphatase
VKAGLAAAASLSLWLSCLSGCTTPAAWTAAPRAASLTASTVRETPPAPFQYLYGSGEAAALSEQAYNLLVDHARLAVEARKAKPGPFASAVLTPAATLDQPATIGCDATLPLAAVFDMDETAVLNLGYEYGDARSGAGYDAARWARFEKTGGGTLVAAPGAVRAFTALRALGVTVVVNSNRNAAASAETEAALAAAGLGDFRHGETLFLRGDADGQSGKDGRRLAIAARYCVIAMGGDQLGDFSDLFAGAPGVRRTAVQQPAVQGFFGRFWFILPNPVYGAGLAGGWDEVFPADKRWSDPAGAGAQAGSVHMGSGEGGK